jgi:hypothetical protein
MQSLPGKTLEVLQWPERLRGKASGPVNLLEATAIRMETEDASTKMHRILATVWVFHKTTREIEGVLQMPSQTSFRIWKTPLIAGCVVSHKRHS